MTNPAVMSHFIEPTALGVTPTRLSVCVCVCVCLCVRVRVYTPTQKTYSSHGPYRTFSSGHPII